MKNKLEDFVNRHREEFDTELPQRNLWKEIEKQPVTPVKKMFRLFSRTQIAASLLVLANAAILFFLVQRKSVDQNTIQVSPATTQSEQSAAPVYEQQLDEISKVVTIKQARLKEIEKANPVLYKTFVSALQQLSSSYQELEKELNNNPNKEQLLEAMIQNLSLQQELLNQQLSIFQTIKQNKHESSKKNI